MQCPVCDIGGAHGGNQIWKNAERFVVKCPRCGFFLFDWLTLSHRLHEEWKDKRFIIAGMLRRRVGGDPVELTEETVERMFRDAPVPANANEYVDSLLLYLAGRQERPWEPITHDKEKDFPLLFMKSPEDMNGFINFARDLGYLDYKGADWRFSVKGWKRVEELRSVLPTARQAFVAMWFHSSFDVVFDEGLKPGVEDSEYFTAVRADRAEHLGLVDDWIVAQIRRSGLVVADVSVNRGGVYYEAGYARALGVPVIVSCREDRISRVHFDLNHFPLILWQNPADLRERLDSRIRATVLPSAAEM